MTMRSILTCAAANPRQHRQNRMDTMCELFGLTPYLTYRPARISVVSN